MRKSYMAHAQIGTMRLEIDDAHASRQIFGTELMV